MMSRKALAIIKIKIVLNLNMYFLEPNMDFLLRFQMFNHNICFSYKQMTESISSFRI
jgi:hypothetical protein